MTHRIAFILCSLSFAACTKAASQPHPARDPAPANVAIAPVPAAAPTDAQTVATVAAWLTAIERDDLPATAATMAPTVVLSNSVSHGNGACTSDTTRASNAAEVTAAADCAVQALRDEAKLLRKLLGAGAVASAPRPGEVMASMDLSDLEAVASDAIRFVTVEHEDADGSQHGFSVAVGLVADEPRIVAAHLHQMLMDGL